MRSSLFWRPNLQVHLFIFSADTSEGKELAIEQPNIFQPSLVMGMEDEGIS